MWRNISSIPASRFHIICSIPVIQFSIIRNRSASDGKVEADRDTDDLMVSLTVSSAVRLGGEVGESVIGVGALGAPEMTAAA